jgi:hypothetical protein
MAGDLVFDSATASWKCILHKVKPVPGQQIDGGSSLS